MNALAVTDLLPLILASAAAGQALLCVMVVLTGQSGDVPRNWLAGLFGTLATLAISPVIIAIRPDGLALMAGLILVGLYTLPPLFWGYVRALTRREPVGRWSISAWHLAGPVLALANAVLIWTLPAQSVAAILATGELPAGLHAALAVLGVFVLVLGWSLVSAVYVWRILTRLRAYRRALHDQFSNTERRELAWLRVMVQAVILVWLAIMALLVWDNLIADLSVPPVFGSLVIMGLTAMLAARGLSQYPGLASMGLASADPVGEDTDTDEPAKYRKSALEPEHADRIAARIEAAMAGDALYLDANLSLPKLAKAIAVPANLVSQVLNQTLDTTFFDYVNRCRIEASLPHILAGKATVLTIALDVGFNSRSTFYTAFKNVTGQTPRQWRAGHDEARAG
ncbi:helix-turn-helix transcriptional regulator [Maricaulis sp.]|uniref:helix-turn-helix domain-containing protein n=1 Tax=Maricaulis sp. TaxID=1486257 RepID=UPI002639E8B4|nr:helix-turn-helix transcriptional regulator [Maricaulis sp.]MDF1770040.1 helix-turn-helix transcriptional regulator [Maricaulis sp.]